MSMVKTIARDWHCMGCGRNWSPYVFRCEPCAKKYTPDEFRALLERSGYRKRIDRMVQTLEKAGV